MDISENGDKILLGFRSGKASIIDVDGNKVSTFDKHRLDINSVSLSVDGKMVFTGSSDRKAHLWETDSRKNVHDFSHGSRVNHVKISADAEIAFTMDAIKDHTFWSLSTGKLLSELDTIFRVSDGALIAEWQSEMTRGRSSILSVAYSVQDKAVTINSDGLFEQ